MEMNLTISDICYLFILMEYNFIDTNDPVTRDRIDRLLRLFKGAIKAWANEEVKTCVRS